MCSRNPDIFHQGRVVTEEREVGGQRVGDRDIPGWVVEVGQFGTVLVVCMY